VAPDVALDCLPISLARALGITIAFVVAMGVYPQAFAHLGDL